MIEQLDPIEEEVERRVSAVNTFYMGTDHIKAILERIHALRLRGYRSDGSAMCMQLSGPTGSGKTMLFDSYMARPDAQSTHDHVPVLRLQMPSKYRETAFAGAILGAYGAEPFTAAQDQVQLERRARKLMSAKRTKLIMVDDLQHVIDQKERTAKVPYYAADQFKNFLLDGAKIPVVFNGLPICDQLYERNTQLKMRRMYKDDLKPFNWTDVLQREQFTVMVTLFTRRAGFKNWETLDDGLVERVWRATHGVPGNASTLFKTVAELGTHRRADKITLELLAEAHAQNADAGPDWKNMFTMRTLHACDDEVVPDQSRVTKLTKNIARIGNVQRAR